MQLLLAYAFNRQPDAAEVQGRLGRVAAHYEPLWQVPVERRGVDAGRVGLHVWDAAKSPWRWPSWQQDDHLCVVTLYLPLGYDRVVGDLEPGRASLALARALIDRPSNVLEMTAPFVIASLDQNVGRLRLHTDALGVGRLYELRFPAGWVWTNRPAAACRFAGTRAVADRDGWRMLAASDWFLGDRTPFAGVFAVQGGVTIDYDPTGAGCVHSRVDALAAWSVNRTDNWLTDRRIDEVADAMVAAVASVERMSPEPIVSDLSGGRDSRLVSAAVLAAGLAVTLNTGGAEPGEADTAERLVAVLPAEVAGRIVGHRVRRPTVTGPDRTFGLPRDARIVPNALAWHRYQEGLRSPTYLPTAAPTHLEPGDHITLGGSGGEIAHGHFYPSNWAELGDLPWAGRLDALADPLAEQVLGAWGVSAVARESAMARVRQTLEEAIVVGLTDATALDYFYAEERLRRWGTTAERCGRVSPLLAPEWVRAALTITPAERRANALHRAVTGRLIPAWKDEPYYRAPSGTVHARFTPRLGNAVDKAVISSIVADFDVWGDGYDTKLVAQSWQSMLNGTGRAADERILQRVIWRAVFEDFLREVNDEEGAPRIELERPPLKPRLNPMARGRRFAARGFRKLARMVEPPA